MGFRDIADPDQTEHELEVMDWFLSQWLDLLPMTDGIL
jgi:hypothetical protein